MNTRLIARCTGPRPFDGACGFLRRFGWCGHFVMACRLSLRRLGSGLGLAVEHMDHPWKIVPASLIIFQLRRMLGIGCARIASASRFGIPLNLFDAMRVVLRAP
jgi:hypothetical protein